jgi:hypothetical protein
MKFTEMGKRDGKSKPSCRIHSGNATASAYSSRSVSRNVLTDSLLSSLCVHRTQEKDSLQSNGIQAN